MYYTKYVNLCLFIKQLFIVLQKHNILKVIIRHVDFFCHDRHLPTLNIIIIVVGNNIFLIKFF
jgi:hypothetical protein